MGFDLSVVTKDEIVDSNGKKTKYHFLVDRGFCTFIENARNHSADLIEEAERVLQFDLNFLLIPQYYDPESFSEENLREMGLTEEQIIEHYKEPVKASLKLNLFY